MVFYLIDDDEDDREIFLDALLEVGDTFQCFSAKNGREAIHQLTTGISLLPDIIFLDLNMPYMTGHQCLREIKQSQVLESVPVVIYTTSSNPKDIEESRSLGAAHYFIKPSRVDDLIKILGKLLKKQNLTYLLNQEL